MKEKFIKAINEIDFDNMCEDQKSTLEKALVMLRVKYENNAALNVKYENVPTKYPTWSWNAIRYSIIEPKKTVPLDFTDADKLIGKAIIDKRDNSKHLITNVYEDNVYCGDIVYTYQELYNWCAFIDGSPISKEIE